MAKVALREDVKLAGPSGAGVLLGERVREAGLDPSVFAAVLPGACGMAGVLNGNGRIYATEQAVAEHERLCAVAASEAVIGERNHPQGTPTWDVLTRFMGGSTEIREDGSAVFHGRFAVLNNSLGRDMLVAWRAGVPVGVSLRARGMVEDQVLDAASPYARANPGAVGRRFQHVTDVEFEGYDWVRVPSAGTYVAPPTPEVTEALRRLSEAVTPEEGPMKWDDFVKANPEAVKTALAEATAAKDAELVQVRADLDAARAQLTEAKAAQAGIAEQLKELVEAKREADKALAAAKLRTEVTEALDTFIKGRRSGALLRTLVLEELAEGRIASVAAAEARAAKLAALTEGAQGGNANGAPAGPAPDGSPSTPVTKTASDSVAAL